MGLTVLEPGEVTLYPAPSGMEAPELKVIDTYVNRYQSGKIHVDYLLDGLMDAMVKEMDFSIGQKFDNIIIISGREGSGKSSLAYQICKTYDPDFSMERGYIYNFDEFLDAIRAGDDRGRTFWLDESSNIANRYNWMTTDNKAFNQILEMMRSRGWTLVMCIPQEDRLDNYVRSCRARFKLKCKIRGWTKDTRARRGYYELYRVVPQERGDAYDQLVGYGQFEPMPPRVAEKYEAIKSDSQIRKLDEIATKKETVKDNGIKLRRSVLYMHGTGLTAQQIADIVGCNEQTVYNMLTKARKEQGTTD